MTSTSSIPVLTPPAVYPPCTDPGYVTTLSLGGSDYQVFAYTEDTNGTKTYLPSTCDPQAFEKIRGLTWGLLNAHDSRRTSLNEAPYELKALDSKGLIKTDNTIVSHDFLIQPVSTLVADQMASAVSLAGHPMQAAAIKAQDVWTTMEEIIRREMGSTPNPVQLGTSTNPSAPNSTLPASSLPVSTNPVPPPITQPASQIPPDQVPGQNPANTSSDTHSDLIQLQPYRAPITATDLNLRGFDFEQANWYERISNRTKLRIVTDILENRCPVGGVYEKVWKLFEAKVRNNPSSTMIELLTQEKNLLANRCRALPSTIHTPIRREAAKVIEAHQEDLAEEELQEKILSLMEKEFERKEQLFECIREQAEAEGVAIEDWDHRWAQYHYLENTHRFIQALARWLDNN